jgi:hypothetical protein
MAETHFNNCIQRKRTPRHKGKINYKPYAVWSSTFHHCDKIPEKNKRRENLFFLMVSLHVCLAPLLWGCGKAEHHGGEHVVEQNSSLHCGQDIKRERGGGRGSNIPIKGTPQWPNFLSLDSTSPKSHPFLQCHMLLTELSTFSHWWPFKIQTITVTKWVRLGMRKRVGKDVMLLGHRQPTWYSGDIFFWVQVAFLKKKISLARTLVLVLALTLTFADIIQNTTIWKLEKIYFYLKKFTIFNFPHMHN